MDVCCQSGDIRSTNMDIYQDKCQQTGKNTKSDGMPHAAYNIGQKQKYIEKQKPKIVDIRTKWEMEIR